MSLENYHLKHINLKKIRPFYNPHNLPPLLTTIQETFIYKTFSLIVLPIYNETIKNMIKLKSLRQFRCQRHRVSVRWRVRENDYSVTSEWI